MTFDILVWVLVEYEHIDWWVRKSFKKLGTTKCPIENDYATQNDF